MLRPRARSFAPYSPKIWAAFSGLLSRASAAADGNAPSMSRNRCTVPPSSSPEANTGSFDRAATAATSAVTSPVWAPTSA